VRSRPSTDRASLIPGSGERLGRQPTEQVRSLNRLLPDQSAPVDVRVSAVNRPSKSDHVISETSVSDDTVSRPSTDRASPITVRLPAQLRELPVSVVNRPSKFDHRTIPSTPAEPSWSLGRQPTEQVRSQSRQTPARSAAGCLGRQLTEQVRRWITRLRFKRSTLRLSGMGLSVLSLGRQSMQASGVVSAVSRPSKFDPKPPVKVRDRGAFRVPSRVPPEWLEFDVSAVNRPSKSDHPDETDPGTIEGRLGRQPTEQVRLRVERRRARRQGQGLGRQPTEQVRSH
jgi:hypothetical protein